MKRWNIPVFISVGILFGLKTYIIYRFVLNIEIDNFMQEVIILVNPFIVSIVFFSLSIWLRTERRQLMFMRYAALFGTLIIYFNVIFYRSFTDFLTLPQLFQTSNALDLGTSVMSLVKVYDLFMFIDVILIWYMTRSVLKNRIGIYTARKKLFLMFFAVVLLSFNFVLAQIERPQLFSRGFDREYLVKNIGIFYYHIYDVIMQSKLKTQRVLADENELDTIKKYIESDVRSSDESELFGIAKNRNIIFISAESIQSFVINNELHGEEITPFLNRLVNNEDTFYFENFYHQTEQGKTSDSEFITENSLYPSSRGAVFFTHAQNEFHALPEIIEEDGYESVVFHANNDSFWNRNQMYKRLKIDTFYDKDYYDVTDDNSVGWGLEDKHFFDQSIPYLREINEPFYAKFLTLTNHFPFELGETERTLEPYDSNSNTLNNYFPTVRYTDEAIEDFFIQLKAAGLYKNSVIIIMGDHDGISANHNRAMSLYLDKEEITPFDYIQLQRVPFYIHIPGYGEGRVMEKVSGQIDIKPTLLHLLGIDTKQDIYFGNDLFHNDRKDFIALRNGDYISEEFIFTSQTCYERNSGEIIWSEYDATDATNDDMHDCMILKRKVETELNYSDNIIYGDLFRFIDFNDAQ